MPPNNLLVLLKGSVMRNPDISVVIPVFRSESRLQPLTERLLRVLEATGLSHEVIFVEDGGDDGSWQRLRQLRSDHPDRIVVIQLMRNYGQHNALMCGLRVAKGEYIVTMDDDLQNPPEEIPKLLEAIAPGDLDLVYGRYPTKKHDRWRNAGSWLVNAFYRKVFRNSITITSFRVIRRPLVDMILSYDLNFTFIDGLLAWNTRRIGQVDVQHHPRTTGRSGYDLGKLTLLALNLFTNFSLLPLQVVSYCGLAISASGFLVAVYYLIQAFLSHITVPGYASTITAVLIIGGTQLLALGIIGEYLGRLHLNVNRKPQYQVREAIGLTPAGSGADAESSPRLPLRYVAPPANRRLDPAGESAGARPARPMSPAPGVSRVRTADFDGEIE
jgi:glycosyltransferase involved in cell wall biosynthesis